MERHCLQPRPLVVALEDPLAALLHAKVEKRLVLQSRCSTLFKSQTMLWPTANKASKQVQILIHQANPIHIELHIQAQCNICSKSSNQGYVGYVL